MNKTDGKPYSLAVKSDINDFPGNKVINDQVISQESHEITQSPRWPNATNPKVDLKAILEKNNVHNLIKETKEVMGMTFSS